MIKLTEDQAEEIQDFLWQLYHIEDNTLYHHYSKDGLKKRLEEINEIICYLYPTYDE